jgi:hypothetical protein
MIRTYTKATCSMEASKDNKVTTLRNQQITTDTCKPNKTGKVDFLEDTAIPKVFAHATSRRSLFQ